MMPFARVKEYWNRRRDRYVFEDARTLAMMRLEQYLTDCGLRNAVEYVSTSEDHLACGFQLFKN